MFTGIIESTSRVVAQTPSESCTCVRIRTPRGWRLTRGQSVAIDGVCSTVARVGRGYFDVEYMQETLDKTIAARATPGTVINLERSMRVGDRVEGHFVAGHVDARGTIRSVRDNVLTMTVPASLGRFLAVKGSVTVNGVALTVTRATRSSFSVALIPHTSTHTNLGALKSRAQVNVEIDMVARYLDSLLKKR